MEPNLAFSVLRGYSIQKKPYRVSGWSIESNNVIGIAENEGFLMQDEASNEKAADWLHSALQNQLESKLGTFLQTTGGVVGASIVGIDAIAKADPLTGKMLNKMGWDNDWLKIQAEAAQVGTQIQGDVSSDLAMAAIGYGAGKLLKGLQLQGHHNIPKFMGGFPDQGLSWIPKTVHKELHLALQTALKKAGFPNVGGIGGATADWIAFLERNPGSQQKAFDILLEVTRKIDAQHGTNISVDLWKNLILKSFDSFK